MYIQVVSFEDIDTSCCFNQYICWQFS